MFCAFCFVFCNFLPLFMLLSFNLHVRLICAIKHLLTYLLTYYTLRNALLYCFSVIRIHINDYIILYSLYRDSLETGPK